MQSTTQQLGQICTEGVGEAKRRLEENRPGIDQFVKNIGDNMQQGVKKVQEVGNMPRCGSDFPCRFFSFCSGYAPAQRSYFIFQLMPIVYTAYDNNHIRQQCLFGRWAWWSIAFTWLLVLMRRASTRVSALRSDALWSFSEHS